MYSGKKAACLFLLGVFLVQTSSKGIEFLKASEGFRSDPYFDGGGYMTVGYGHLIKSGEDYGEGLTKEEAERLLEADLQEAETVVEVYVDVPLKQHQYDALVSFAFNVGSSNFKKSTLLRLLNEGKYEEVPKQLLRWNKSGGKVLKGLTKRRKREAEIFREGNYE